MIEYKYFLWAKLGLYDNMTRGLYQSDTDFEKERNSSVLDNPSSVLEDVESGLHGGGIIGDDEVKGGEGEVSGLVLPSTCI